jgi:hypothetical protein
MQKDHSDYFINLVRSKSPTTANSPLNPQVLKFGDGSEIVNMGLTKREYFAAMAMQGMAQISGVSLSKEVARQSVEYADALIEALNK